MLYATPTKKLKLVPSKARPFVLTWFLTTTLATLSRTSIRSIPCGTLHRTWSPMHCERVSTSVSSLLFSECYRHLISSHLHVASPCTMLCSYLHLHRSRVKLVVSNAWERKMECVRSNSTNVDRRHGGHLRRRKQLLRHRSSGDFRAGGRLRVGRGSRMLLRVQKSQSQGGKSRFEMLAAGSVGTKQSQWFPTNVQNFVSAGHAAKLSR